MISIHLNFEEVPGQGVEVNCTRDAQDGTPGELLAATEMVAIVREVLRQKAQKGQGKLIEAETKVEPLIHLPPGRSADGVG